MAMNSTIKSSRTAIFSETVGKWPFFKKKHLFINVWCVSTIKANRIFR